MASNIFEDLVPRDAPKPKKAGGANLFADLIPAGPVQHAPGVTGQGGPGPDTGETGDPVGRKGGMRPGDRPITDVEGQFMRSATLNFGDELIAGMAVPVEIAVNALRGEGPTDPSEAYQQIRAYQAAQEAATQQQKPIASAAAGLGGALMPAGGGLKLISAGTGLLGKSIRGAGAGAVIGGVSGAGEGETLDERTANAASGVQIGALVGAGVPTAAKAIGQGVRLLKAVGRATSAPVRSLADKETFAAGKVAEALQRDKLSPERAGRLLRLRGQVKPDTVLADVGGENTQNLLRASANVPSEARGKLVRDLFARQEKQLDRLRADVGQAFGDPKTFAGTVENLTLSRKQTAEPLFDAAFQTGTPWTVQLQSVLSRPLTRKLVERAKEAALNRGEDFKAIFAKIGDDGKITFARVPDTEALHRVKMEIDAAIRSIKKGKETGLGNANVRDLTILKRDLVNSIHNPLYKRALKQYAGDSASLNAIDDGFEEGLTMEPEAITKTLQNLSKAEADLWRLGLARKVVNQLRDTGRAGTNRAEILSSPKYLDRLRAAFKDSPTGKEFMRKLHLERKMVLTRESVRGNSTSAKQFAEGMEAGVEADNVRDALDMGSKLATGNYIGALVSWLGRAKNMATGLRPEVADQIIRMLTSKDPATVTRAQRLVEREIAKLTRRQGAPGRVEAGVNIGGFSAIPNYASTGGQ